MELIEYLNLIKKNPALTHEQKQDLLRATQGCCVAYQLNKPEGVDTALAVICGLNRLRGAASYLLYVWSDNQEDSLKEFLVTQTNGKFLYIFRSDSLCFSPAEYQQLLKEKDKEEGRTPHELREGDRISPIYNFDFDAIYEGNNRGIRNGKHFTVYDRHWRLI